MGEKITYMEILISDPLIKKSAAMLVKTTLPFFYCCCLSDMEKWLSFFLDDYLREREINHQYFRLLLLPFPIWQLAQPAKELAKPAAEIVHVPQCQDDNRLLFFSIQSQNSVVQVCCQPSLQPSNHITRSSWKNGLIPLSYNDNCDDNVIPKMKKNRKKRGEKQKKVLPLEQQAIKSRLSQFNTDPIMWYPETQADFQSSASIHVKHIVLVFLKKGVKSSPKGCWCKRSETHDPMSS